MALIESWLYKRLLADSGVSALVNARVYPVYAPQPDPASIDYPLITFLRVNTQREYISGAKASSDGQPVVTFHVQCWDADYFALKTLEDAVRLALDGVRDKSNGFEVGRCFITDEYDLPEPLIDGFEFPIFGVRFVLEISFTEAVP